jgi:entericidin B
MDSDVRRSHPRSPCYAIQGWYRATLPGVGPGVPLPSFNLKQEETDMKRLITLMVLLSIAGLIGCNTMEGAGKDIERGGEAVSDTAKDVKRSM